MLNSYVVALIGLLAILVVGFLVYGVLFKETLKGHEVKLTLNRFVMTGVGMYIVALAFTVLYQAVSFESGVSGAMKGLYLGLLIGVPFFAVPIFIDGSYLKSRDAVVWTLMANWVISLAVLGLVVGSLIS